MCYFHPRNLKMLKVFTALIDDPLFINWLFSLAMAHGASRLTLLLISRNVFAHLLHLYPLLLDLNFLEIYYRVQLLNYFIHVLYLRV